MAASDPVRVGHLLAPTALIKALDLVVDTQTAPPVANPAGMEAWQGFYIQLDSQRVPGCWSISFAGTNEADTTECAPVDDDSQ